MKPTILIPASLLFLAACNNAPERTKEPADTVAVASMETMINQAIEDSGVHLDYADFGKMLDQRPASSGLWDTQPFRSDLEKLLGADYAAFREAMSEATPLKKDKVYYTWGVLPDDAVKGIGYVVVEPETGKIAAYQNINGKVKEWKTPGTEPFIPQELARKKTEFK